MSFNLRTDVAMVMRSNNLAMQVGVARPDTAMASAPGRPAHGPHVGPKAGAQVGPYFFRISINVFRRDLVFDEFTNQILGSFFFLGIPHLFLK